VVYTYDPEKAKALLAEAGVENLEFTMVTNNNWVKGLAAQIQNDLAAVGITMTNAEQKINWSEYAAPEDGATLAYDVFANFTQLIRKLRSDHPDVHDESQSFGIILFRAVSDGHVAVDQITIKHGAVRLASGNAVIQSEIGAPIDFGIRPDMFPDDIGQGVINNDGSERGPLVDGRVELFHASKQYQYHVMLNVPQIIGGETVYRGEFFCDQIVNDFEVMTIQPMPAILSGMSHEKNSFDRRDDGGFGIFPWRSGFLF